MRWLLSLFLVSALLVGCSSSSDSDNPVGPVMEEDDSDNGSDVPATARFAQDVLPLFQQSCASSGCHGSSASSGVRLSSYEATMSSTGSQYGTLIVQPGNASASPLVDKIQTNPDRGQRMPLGRAAWSTSQIQTVVDWINAGALNN